MNCSNCGTTNPTSAKFCVECGIRLGGACPTCGSEINPGAKFCAECGTSLAPGAVRTAGSMASGQSGNGPTTAGWAGGLPAPVAERRVVSVLFADLVGFTTLAEGRDSEAVRELLSRYFEVAREVVTRYGGTIEKFIGDAVMAVWGTPTAHEDDAERAVRAALELLEAVKSIAAALEARAGVMTGEAAVTIGAAGQGMVAGDLVNTASRLQSAAPQGTVLVGETTQRASSGAIAYEPAGNQLLKGKVAPVPSWRALRVVAQRGGVGRSEGLEAPFVGRDAEIRLLKELFHATGRERRLRLVSIVGQAGIGKSRLAWEFHKYIDGLVEDVYWHQGRSPAYGEGITFWALGEMVRKRAGLKEMDDEATTRQRIAETLDEYAPEEGDRRWLERSLLALLGLAEPPAGGRDELFAAWRTFFERVAARGLTVLVFEDLQWADAGLIDFIDHLLAWSQNQRIFIVTHARPDLLERRPTWGAGQRNFTSIDLVPLPEATMRELLDGLVPGLPEVAIRQILDRADGIPLYAVETIRMLVAEGKLEAAEGRYRPVADLTELAVPESLQALIAARLDALDPPDRSLLQDGAVLGLTFTVPSLAAVSGQTAEQLEPRLKALVRREILRLESDPRSPERGQYGFVQGMIREVAYNGLARRERRARHLAAARFFESLGDDELAGALATHYVAAYHASPEGPEAEAAAVQARLALRGAAQRAAALGSHEQAIRFLTSALGVATNPAEEAQILEEAGESASAAGHYDQAEQFLSQAVDRYRGLGDHSSVTQAVAALGTVLIDGSRMERAVSLLEGALAGVDPLPENAASARLAAQLARAYFLIERVPDAVAWSDRVLAVAEHLDLPEVIADTLATKGPALFIAGRTREGLALMRAAIDLANEHGLVRADLRTRVNLAGQLAEIDPGEGMKVAREGLDKARRLGLTGWIVYLAGNGSGNAIRVGEWEWASGALEDALASELDDSDRIVLLAQAVALDAFRGRPVAARLAETESLAGSVGGLVGANSLATARLYAALAAGQLERAHEEAAQLLRVSALSAGVTSADAARAAIWLGDVGGARADLATHVATGRHGPAMAAARQQIRAGISALEGRPGEAVLLYREALQGWRDLGCVWDLALCAIDLATLIDPDEQLVREAADEAHAILNGLGARPFLDRLEHAMEAQPRVVASGERVPADRTAR